MRVVKYIVVVMVGLCLSTASVAHDEGWNLGSGTTVGAVLGGVVGYRIDKEDGAIVGSILGAIAGSAHNHSNRPRDSRYYSFREEQRLREIIRQRVQQETQHITLSSDELFEPDTAKLKEGAVGKIDSIAASMKRYDRTLVHINGHTDNKEQDYQSKVLSLGQAESVALQLIIRGIPRTRIQTVGVGQEQPLAANDSIDNRRLNRRMEFFVEPVFSSVDRQ